MKQYPRLPDPVEVPTFSQNCKWMQKLRELKDKEKPKNIFEEIFKHQG